MELIQELARASTPGETALTVGVFDGVHRGHRHLLAHLLRRARAQGLTSAVLTLREHPATVLEPNFRPCYLTTLDQRLRLLQETGVDLVVPVTFDSQVARLSARDFVSLLVKQMGMKAMVVGPDFALGRNREGDPRFLKDLGHRMGFAVEVVPPLYDGPDPVRSSVIRRLVAEGQVERAARLLGRHFLLEGRVVEGERRGSQLGFPTANLEPAPGMAVPGHGIYATWAHLDGARLMAATSIGTRPTFGGHARTIEAHILDFRGDLYGRHLGLEFVRRLRDEVKFETVDSLIAQMDRDVRETRAALSAISEDGPDQA